MQIVSDTKNFDLNIEEILENWQIHDGLREIIANALDEQLLTDSNEIEITNRKNNDWTIRDYGRGIHYQHLTMNESDEKIKHPNTMGKFGIGLKDALATFHRNGVSCIIKSKFGDITVSRTQKHGFEEIETLHAIVSPPSEIEIAGTKIMLQNIPNSEMQKAKELFLKFTKEKELEITTYGQILEKSGSASNIYINGVKVAEEENFLFSYNITSLTKNIKDALNRERTNVGRSAYSNRIKRILLSSSNEVVAEELVDDLNSFGDYHDEMNWIDVQEHAVKIYNVKGNILFTTSEEIMVNPQAIDEARSSGMKIVTIPQKLREKISGLKDIFGNNIRDLFEFDREYQDSFEYKFIDLKDLTTSERDIYDTNEDIFKIIGGKPSSVKNIKISETIKKDLTDFTDAVGVYERHNQTIIIRRDQLRKLEDFIGTLLHEVSHATSGRGDVDRRFELELTKIIGLLGSKLISL
ncbi:MAG: DNA topoisomerase 4 subunit B [Candidatus Heimdallarchaeota archaeon LC_2]|nr:MAG: DNA topoisomerase 4 subunit B [Candidatus Heimdallarchaeota archaeon LC_2]